MKKSMILLLIFECFFTLFFIKSAVSNTAFPQNDNFGWYNILLDEGWNYDARNSTSEFYTFNYFPGGRPGYVLQLKKQPLDCPEQKNFNMALSKIMNDLYGRKNYSEKLKVKSEYNVLGDPDCYFVGFTIFDTKEKSFVLLPYDNAQMHYIYIIDKVGKSMELRPEIIRFLSGIKLNSQPVENEQLASASNNSSNSNSTLGNAQPENGIQKNGKNLEEKTIKGTSGENSSAGNTQTANSTGTKTENQAISKPSTTSNTASVSSEMAVSEKEVNLTFQNLKFDKFNFDVDFDFETMSKTQYAGAVSYAMEGMRLIYGEMTDEQELKFNREWLPLFRFPYPEAIIYLNQLNPLIMKFTAIREVLTEEMESYNAAMMDIEVAAGDDDNEQLQETMAELEITVATLNTLTKQLDEVTQAIVKLGNPPNVVEMAVTHKKIHTNALEMIAGPSIPFEGEWVNEKGEHSLIKLAYTYSDGKLLLYVFPVTWLQNMEAKGYDPQNDADLKNNKDAGPIPGTWDFLKVFEPIGENSFAALEWSFVRQVNVYTFEEDEAKLLIYTPPASTLIQSGTQNFSLEKTEETYDKIPVLAVDAGIKTWEDLQKNIPGNEWAKKKYDTYIQWRKEFPEELAIALQGGPDEKQKRINEYQQKKALIDYRYEVESGSNQRAATENRDHDMDRLNKEYGDILNSNKTEETKPEITTELIDYLKSLKAWETEKELQKQKEEQVKFHENNIGYFTKSIESLQSRMNQPGINPDSKNSMYRDLLVQQNSLQREQDAIETLKTGEYVHTRTEHDAFNMQLSLAQSIKKAENVHQTIRALERVPKLIEMASEADRQRLTDFFRKNTNTGSDMPLESEKVLKVAQNIGNQVSGRLEQEAAAAEEAGALAEAKLNAVEYIKTGADAGMTLISIAAPVYYAYSAPNAIAQSMRAAKAARVFSMYTGATGYIEGGISQAFTQTMGSYNAATMTANAFISGYQKGVLNHLEQHAANAGEVELNETNAGLRGAAWEAGKESAKFLIQGMALRYITPQPPARLNSQFTDVANARNTPGSAQVRKWPTVQQQINQANFQSRQADGRAKVKLLKQCVQKLADAGKAGASAEEIRQLRSEVDQAYTVVKGDYFAKGHVNYLARQGDTKIIHSYNSCERNYISKLTAAVDRKMTEAGYSPQKYKTFSNSSSKGKAGMDLDFGVVEPPRYIKNAQGAKVPNPEHIQWSKSITQKLPDGSIVRRSPYDLQSAGKIALESAYQEVYGRPPGEAMVEFTSSYHPEAYRDPSWLGKKGSKTALVFETDRAWVQQAADVSMFKVNHLPKDHPNLGYYGHLQEQMRGLTKDFDTKIEPMLKLKADANPNAATHLREMRNTMDRFAKNEIGPIEADNKIKELTGGRGIVEVAEQLSVAMQGLRDMMK